MPTIADAIRTEIDLAKAVQRVEEQLLVAAKRLRFAWADGRETLYKFKSLTGSACAQVRDIVENSRIYLSQPDQFNDPLDCSPVYVLAKDGNDPEFLEELWLDEARLLSEQGISQEKLADLRVRFGVDVHKLAVAVQENVRRDVRTRTRVFCLSAEQRHPLQWAHYAGGHTGVCLHFRCERHTPFGLAQRVNYQEARPQILVPLRYNENVDIGSYMVKTKAAYWDYEQEYRIIALDETDWGYTLDGPFCSFEPRLLCGITLGMSISASDRNTMREWAANASLRYRFFGPSKIRNDFGWILSRWIRPDNDLGIKSETAKGRPRRRAVRIPRRQHQ